MPSQDCNKALPPSDLPVLTKSDGKGELEHCKESPAASDSGEYNEKRELSAVDSLDKEWAEDQHNPRNWSFGRKWTCVAIVRFFAIIQQCYLDLEFRREIGITVYPHSPSCKFYDGTWAAPDCNSL